MPDTHALLSASAAKRWLNCPPSVRLTENMPDTSSEYAAEGSLAHALGELKLRKRFELMKKSVFDKTLKEIRSDERYSAEMNGYTDTYLDYVSSIMHSYTTKPYIAIEKRLDYSHIAPDGFGTGDCLVMCGGDLHIIDFKYGRGVAVSAEDNPQLKLYALGAVREYEMLYAIHDITLHIVQPRTEEGNSSWKISRADLDAWGESIHPAAQLAYEGDLPRKGGLHSFRSGILNAAARTAFRRGTRQGAGTRPSVRQLAFGRRKLRSERYPRRQDRHGLQGGRGEERPQDNGYRRGVRGTEKPRVRRSLALRAYSSRADGA